MSIAESGVRGLTSTIWYLDPLAGGMLVLVLFAW